MRQNRKQINLPLADIASPGKVNCSRTLRDTESLLGFNAHGRHMRARALRHVVLGARVSQDARELLVDDGIVVYQSTVAVFGIERVLKEINRLSELRGREAEREWKCDVEGRFRLFAGKQKGREWVEEAL